MPGKRLRGTKFLTIRDPLRGRPDLLISRRVGASPAQRCNTDIGCPDVFELQDGRFAVIGTDMTAELEAVLPADAGRAPHERIVVISRETLVLAKSDIPDF